MPDNYENLSRDQLIGLLRKRDLSRRLGLVWERDEIEHERLLEEEFPLVELDSGLSCGQGPWQNLLVEGDNFEALRFLRAAFKGQVKCIYIDPPYNTGNKDFVYNDHYIDKADSFRHSTWLEFLYRRLSLARDLLRDDGVLLVSINDENRALLELLLMQVWPGGRKGSFAWRNRQGSNADQDCFLSTDHEHVLVWSGPRFSFRGFEKSYDMYSNPDNDPRGDWMSDNLTLGFSHLERPNLYYPIHDPRADIWYPASPDNVWRYASQERLKAGQTIQTRTMEEFIVRRQILFPIEQRVQSWASLDALLKDIDAGEVPRVGKNQLLRRNLPGLESLVGKRIGFGRPRFKRYKADLFNENQPLSSWIASTTDDGSDGDSFVVGTNQEGARELQSILGSRVFNYPKPPSLLRGLIDQSTGPGDLILDFFAGSATTAQAVDELNKQDINQADEAGVPRPEPRRWIMVSSTEASDEEPDKNIARDVAARRLTALELEFAYLRMQRVPTLAAFESIDPEWLLPSLQLLQGGMIESPVPMAGGGGDSQDIRWTSGPGFVLTCLTSLDAKTLDKLEAFAPPVGATAIVATFRPGILRQRLGDRADFKVIALPDALVAALSMGRPEGAL